MGSLNISSNFFFSVQTPSGKRYFVSFIDDATDYSRVYLLRTKDETIMRFKEFCAEIKAQHGYNVKKLRADGAGEYTSGAMKAYLRQHGMIFELSPPHTPQLNGKSERYNRTVVQMARAMLTSSYRVLTGGRPY